MDEGTFEQVHRFLGGQVQAIIYYYHLYYYYYYYYYYYSQGGSLSSNLKVICQDKDLSHFSCVTICSLKTILATFLFGES